MKHRPQMKIALTIRPSPDSVTQIDEPQMNETNELTLTTDESDESKARRFVDFFNPTVLNECAQIIMRKRANHGRVILIYMLFVYFISIGPVIGESANEYNLTRLELNWGSVSYAHYSMYTIALGLIGTTIMIALFKKCLKMPDTFIGVISSALGIVTRIIFVNIFFNLQFSSNNSNSTAKHFISVLLNDIVDVLHRPNHWSFQWSPSPRSEE